MRKATLIAATCIAITTGAAPAFAAREFVIVDQRFIIPRAQMAAYFSNKSQSDDVLFKLKLPTVDVTYACKGAYDENKALEASKRIAKVFDEEDEIDMPNLLAEFGFTPCEART